MNKTNTTTSAARDAGQIIVTPERATEYEAHQFEAFASDLRIPPGQWPAALDTTLGNRQPLICIRHGENGATYRQQLGCITLRVFND